MKALTKISRATNSKGFTLVEILITITLIALVTAFAVPSFSRILRGSNDGYATKVAQLLRQARDRALLTDKLIRLRIDLDKQVYWLEEAPSSYMLPKAENKNLTEREKEEADKKEESTYRLVKELTPDKVELPSGLKIIEVRTPRQRDPIKEGIVDVFFFNNGNADGVSILFETEEQTHQTLTLHPVTGQSKVRQGKFEE